MNDDDCLVASDAKDDGDGGHLGGATTASRARGATAEREREHERNQKEVRTCSYCACAYYSVYCE